MASSSDMVKKIMRLKLQLMDTLESATVLKILQKLQDLDVTLDILAETGIGKTVNSFRRHEQAGEFAKSLVRGWKRLVPKESTSQTDDGDSLESLFLKDKLDDKDCQNDGSSLMEDLNNNFSKYRDDGENSSDQVLFKTRSRKANSEQDYEEQIRQKHRGEKHNDSKERTELRKDKSDNSVVSKETRYDQNDRKSGDYGSLLGSKNTEDTQQKKARPDSKDKMKSNSDRGRLKDSKESFSFESREKHSKSFKVSSDKDERSPGTWRSAEAQNGKRKKASEEKDAALKTKQECEHKLHSNHKKKKSKTKPKEESGLEEPSMSFESCLNYDPNVLKRKSRSGVKKPPKVVKTAEREATTDPGVDAFTSSATSLISEKQLQESVMELMNDSSPLLPEYEKPISVEYFEKKVEKESNFCDFSEESAVFTGQRLNRKMQVYSGAKTISLPTMMSLHQQCIRTLQNNINLLYETGGVPFEILEPVLERCTPEQLLRIEEYNPIYVGATDHLWGKHCQRDFKDAKLQEYESWKEMFIRLSEEREMKLKRLTKSIVSAHSNKPKGRQVKMAFIHTAAKPPRDVRIQQEIHGTAVQQPPQLRCSVKVPDNRSRSSNEHSRSSSNASGSSSTQDPRKKTRVAPMMAKSLKAFKKQLGRR